VPHSFKEWSLDIDCILGLNGQKENGDCSEKETASDESMMIVFFNKIDQRSHKHVVSSWLYGIM
jgi:hypothetical protein